ncbi:dTDP-4-dehydrorhamnose reductase [Rhodobacter capsulatus SB 1003]|uniref:dTDP-4-dehydrorhamnose reductase n=1 Tax=Rhodobacter capsulatus (strain ATCC BAA-309 / NBRC 16581 / SB1003) TaxID=272942 RepID=D5AL83_RHOCB|nr:dTDP-4-dehydrorhamnose reductase [Rhodobacter capsulatus]ADE83939.1 dTDP-4-dehydrorhamnose reductase [Rhodobacter capsulatus SB 1003]
MKVLVFGRTGQVATELQRQLPQARFLGREQADLADPEACAAAIRDSDAEAVINAAAWTAVDKAETEEAAATVVNGAAPAAMARACAARGIPFLHVSTDYVFSGAGSAPWVETDPVAPQNAYGRSKLAGEQGVRAAGGAAAILRTSWVFSAHGANFVKTMLRLSESRDALNVVEDQIGGPTPAADIAAALIVDGAEDGRRTSPAAPIISAASPWVSWADFAREIFALAGRKVAVTGIPTAAYPTPALRPLNSRMDCAALARDFGIAAPDWQAGLSKVLKELEI